MSCLHRLLLLAAPLTLLVGVGCSTSGGQTGEESTDPCDEASVELALDEVSPVGFSPNDLLSRVGEATTAGLEWQSISDLQYGPEGGTSSIAFTVKGVVRARYIQSEVRTNGRLAMPICADRVEVTVNATAATAGGAIAEAFQTTLFATAEQDVWLSQLFGPADLSGSFAIEPQSLGTRRFIRLTLEAHWSTNGFGGRIAAGIEQGGGTSPDSTASLSTIPVACFSDSATFDPAAGCTSQL